MKALVKKEAVPGLWLEQVDEPVPDPNDVLIRVDKAAICGTDLHIYNWDKWARSAIPVPMVVGHEYVGVVEQVGSAIKTVVPGQRVSGEGHIMCGVCRNCRGGRGHLCRDTRGVGVNRPGAFAEYVCIPAVNAYPIPDDIPDDIAALLDPLGNAVHTALSFDLVGEDVLITGAGPIGVMAAAVARHVGARHIVVTDINDARLALAARMGAGRAVRADRTDLKDVMRELEMQEGFDVGLEMSGSPSALADQVRAAMHGGNLALLGLYTDPLRIDLNEAIFKGLTIKGIYGRKMFETWHKSVAMLNSGLNVGEVITHRLPFEDYEKGFQALNAGKACKIILDLHE
ncbi:MAG: L-threonine 3-dehydrogenase [Gammaproteobacteria bacterium]|nr:L-threonine 3-dehydrogenase [Gammaproteobacteria bacterium]